MNGGRLWIPSIKKKEGVVYHPPVPTRSWGESAYEKVDAGYPGFYVKDVAVRYTVIMLVMKNFDDALKPFLCNLLKKCTCNFEPQRLFVAPRRRDPMKMIVLYDNDKRKIEPTAVCLQISPNEGLFALVDDFGKIMRDTCLSFIVN